MRYLTLPIAAVVSCAPQGIPVLGVQAPIRAHLVVHVDPLPRLGDQICGDARLEQCGELDGRAWQRRTNNLSWLAAEWLDNGRTMDLQLGPESALAWMGNSTVIDSLAGALGDQSLRETEVAGRTAVAALVDGGAADLGVHLHRVLPDSVAGWGELVSAESPNPCDTSRTQPLQEYAAEDVEDLVFWSAQALAPLALTVGAEITSFTSHAPRTMATKQQVIEDVDGIDPMTQRAFPGTFRPHSLGAAYSECFQQAVDHPPFEAYASNAESALAPGLGPPIVPGQRIVGSMAAHLGADIDGSVAAARRRLVQLLLNWRVAGLRGEADRPWVYTMHEHLFDLGAGEVDERDPNARQRNASRGQMFRSDLKAIARSMDELASLSTWHGVAGFDGGVLRWTPPTTVDAEGSIFAYVTEEGEPISDFERESYPYLPLVAERLANGHLRCTAKLGLVDAFVFDRCDGGWAWGGASPGYHCVDTKPPSEVAVFVGTVEHCLSLSVPDAMSAPITGDHMDAVDRCPGGIWLPLSGLIVEPDSGERLFSEGCDTISFDRQ